MNANIQHNTSTLTFPEVRVVEASAGSGKTYVLAKRYVSLLLSLYAQQKVSVLTQMLAITFTNKAAFEMKQRIILFLKKIALDDFSSERERSEFLALLSIKSELLQDYAQQLLDTILSQYHFFSVQTIDSFINSLLKSFSFSLNLSSKFEVKTSAKEYLKYSFDVLIDKPEAKDIFRSFLKQYMMLENRTNWYPKKDILALMEQLFFKKTMYGKQFAKVEVSIEDLLILKRDIITDVKKLFLNLPEGTNKTFISSVEKFVTLNLEGFDVDSLSLFFAREQVPVRKGFEVPVATTLLWENIKESIKNVCDLESASLFNCYLDIFEYLMQEFDVLAKKDNALFLEQLNQKAYSIFQSESFSVPELYYRIAMRIRHYLVDEFQDTSVLQWNNMEKMVAETLSTGGSFFYVGDKKQAIYRYRGGEVSLFNQIPKIFSEYNVVSEQLTTNYRSQKAIVDFNNFVFSQSNLESFLILLQDMKKGNLELEQSHMQDILESFSSSQQQALPQNDKGFVVVQCIKGSDSDERALVTKNETIVLLKYLVTRFEYRDIGLLARNNEEVQQITQWCVEHDIPVESDNTLNIREHPVIKEIISVLHFLETPIDNLSFAAFITGDLFSSCSSISCDVMHEFVFNYHLMNDDKDASNTIPLYQHFKREYPKLWETYLSSLFKNSGLMPLYEFVISIYTTFDLVQRFPQSIAFFMRLLELIKEKENEISDISSFVEYFRQALDHELYVQVDHENAVQVMTIHKSKGLEFDVVIVPFLKMNIKVDPLVVYSSNELYLRRIKTSYTKYSPQLATFYKQEYTKSLIDELNVLYVALTRPKKELYVFIPEKAGQGVNMAQFFIPEAYHQVGDVCDYQKTEDKVGVFRTNISPGTYRDWFISLENERMHESQLKNRQRIAHGDIFHYLLSYVGNCTTTSVEDYLAQALRKAKAQFPELHDLDEYVNKIAQIISHDACKPFFYLPEQSTVYQEKSIVTRFGHTKTIDRLIVGKNEVVVVDYKSSEENEDMHQKQVQEYMQLMQEIYPEKKVTGYLLYLDEIKVEKI